jgi:hypothetical protein
MEQEVAEKLALVDALTQEQAALQAKARALEGLLTSAGAAGGGGGSRGSL